MIYMVCNRNYMIDRSMTSKSWNNRSYDVKNSTRYIIVWLSVIYTLWNIENPNIIVLNSYMYSCVMVRVRPTWYNWNIVESGAKHPNPNHNTTVHVWIQYNDIRIFYISQGINNWKSDYYISSTSNMKIVMLFHDFDVIGLLFHDFDVIGSVIPWFWRHRSVNHVISVTNHIRLV
jgi:hypothetical protein